MIINRDSETSMQSSVTIGEALIAQPQKTPRLKCIDAYRGLTMLGMVLVDNSGPHPLWPLDQTKWDGLTTADLIFPAFLFIMGFAVPLAVRKPIRPVKMFSRILGLFAIGFLLNLTAHTFHFQTVRIMGVLQRLSLCYLLLVLLHIATGYGQKQYQKFGLMAIILLNFVYFCLMLSFDKDCDRSNNLSPTCNFSRWLDQKMFTLNHILKPTDPEGVFSTLSALFTTYGGYYFCLVMRDHKGNRRLIYRDWLVIVATCGASSGLVSMIMPYNKKLWSTSFSLATVGISGGFLTLMMFLIDDVGSTNPSSLYDKTIDVTTRPLIWLGMNPLAIFVMMDLLGIILIRCVVINGTSAWSYFYHYAFHTWIGNDQLCSTVFSLFFALLWTFVAWVMFRFKVFIKL